MGQSFSANIFVARKKYVFYIFVARASYVPRISISIKLPCPGRP